MRSSIFDEKPKNTKDYFKKFLKFFFAKKRSKRTLAQRKKSLSEEGQEIEIKQIELNLCRGYIIQSVIRCIVEIFFAFFQVIIHALFTRSRYFSTAFLDSTSRRFTNASWNRVRTPSIAIFRDRRKSEFFWSLCSAFACSVFHWTSWKLGRLLHTGSTAKVIPKKVK